MKSERTLHITTSADHGFALGATVAIRSALERLPGGVRMVVHFLDNGLTPHDRERMLASWREFAPDVHWYRPDAARFAHLPIDPKFGKHLNLSTYCRLFLAELLPADVDRLIHLDGDVLVLKDLTLLRDEPLGENILAAAIEPAVPTVASAEVRLKRPGKEPPAERLRPDLIPNHRALGMPPETPYFNSGVFVTDLRRWREENLTRRLLDCLRDHAAHVRCHDQYAVNVVFHGRIRRLDLRWNRPANLDNFAFPEETLLSPAEFEAAKTDPWILHFAGSHKPWLRQHRPTGQALYFEHLARTAWPVPVEIPPFRKWLQRQQDGWNRIGRKVRRWFGGNRRRGAA